VLLMAGREVRLMLRIGRPGRWKRDLGIVLDGLRLEAARTLPRRPLQRPRIRGRAREGKERLNATLPPIGRPVLRVPRNGPSVSRSWAIRSRAPLNSGYPSSRLSAVKRRIGGVS